VHTCPQADPNLTLEAKAWLVDTVAALQNVDADTALACFLPDRSSCTSGSFPDPARDRDRDRDRDRGRAPPLGRAAERQLLKLACEARAPQLAALLAGSPSFLRGLFSHPDAPDLAAAWFGGFSLSGIHTFEPGAAALANFALAHRDSCWHFLVWAGKHPQAPVAVAAKPHYFCELDVAATVRKLAGSCPEFWESRELRRSLEGGEWLGLDLQYCSQVRLCACGAGGGWEGGGARGMGVGWGWGAAVGFGLGCVAAG
jgi:hypothetical protein